MSAHNGFLFLCFYYNSPEVAFLTLLTHRPFICSTCGHQPPTNTAEFSSRVFQQSRVFSEQSSLQSRVGHWAEVLSSCPPKLPQPNRQRNFCQGRKWSNFLSLPCRLLRFGPSFNCHQGNMVVTASSADTRWGPRGQARLAFGHKNIAKGTTDPRVKFILPKLYRKLKHKS